MILPWGELHTRPSPTAPPSSSVLRYIDDLDCSDTGGSAFYASGCSLLFDFRGYLMPANVRLFFGSLDIDLRRTGFFFAGNYLIGL
jgi:hypothetical protein